MNADNTQVKARLFHPRSSAFICGFIFASIAAAQTLKLEDVGEATMPDTIEIRGVAAGAFDAKIWQAAKLHLVRDIRRPMLEPRPGTYRNIYAPSIVQTPSGFAVFYAAWDGVETGNDRIYRADTRDFVRFDNRRTVIENGVFQHVCNVSATLADGKWALMCTAYPDGKGLNKPAAFFSKDGETFEPATLERIINMTGYEKFADADINGMNVLLREEGKYRLYFNNFKDFGTTFRASSDDGKNFTFDGVALEKSVVVNDVKKLKSGRETWYLMALHMNGPQLWYTLSRDGMKFPPMQTLITHGGDDDKFIVAVGYVVQDDRVLGFLYGAGAVGSLDQNRIFAVWLQKKVTVNDKPLDWLALGPDRQVLKTTDTVRGRLKLLHEGGERVIGIAAAVLKPGRAYQLTRD